MPGDLIGAKTIALRSTIESLGGKVVWDDETKMATVYLDNQSILLYVGDENGSHIRDGKMYTDDTKIFAALGSIIDLGNGWSGRIERNTAGGNYQKHVHIYNGKQHWSQNEDGSPHDGGNNSPGAPPNSTLKKLNKQKGWDWTRKENEWMNKIEIGYVQSGYTLICYPDARTVNVYISGLSMPYSPSEQDLRDYSFGTTSIYLDSAGYSGGIAIPIPYAAPTPAVVPGLMPMPVLP